MQREPFAEKARIQSREPLPQALTAAFRQINTHLSQEKDLDQEFKLSRLPDQLQFLLFLSKPPSQATVAHASVYLDNLNQLPPPPTTLTWATIIAEDGPFEGEHWEGIYGLPHGMVKGNKSPENGGFDDLDSSLSLSPLNSDDLALDDDSSDDSIEYTYRRRAQRWQQEGEQGGVQDILEDEDIFATTRMQDGHGYAHRKELEDLQEKQYWRENWRMKQANDKHFDLGDPATLGHTVAKIIDRRALTHEGGQQLWKYIYEQDAVREVLIALQGHSSILFTWDDSQQTFVVIHDAPRLRHLSSISQDSILSWFGTSAGIVQQLRVFVKSVLSQGIATPYATKRITKTLEAFADAVDQEVRRLDSWCADREVAQSAALAGVPKSVGGDPMIVSLLDTEMAFRNSFSGSFEAILEIITYVFGGIYADVSSLHARPSFISAHLLDTLFLSTQQHLERGETIAADSLMRVFVTSVEPLWKMTGNWLQEGMNSDLNSSDLDPEFFIESCGVGALAVGIWDSDFWAEAYTLRDAGEDGREGEAGRRNKGTPLFLKHVAASVLSAGKSVGLLKLLGITIHQPLVWRPFADVIAATTTPQGAKLFSISVDTLSSLLYEELSPYCEAIGALAAKTLVEECQLRRHLDAIHGLYFMQRGDIMNQFAQRIFEKMDFKQHWGDFHFLNSAFSDVMEASLPTRSQSWIEVPLVRISSKGTGNKNLQSVRVLEGLHFEYAVPFPLGYIFTPHTFKMYGEICVFLMQIRRLKHSLESIMVRGYTKKEGNDLKVFHALRGRLVWFINTLLSFVNTYVIHTQVLDFREKLEQTKSLDELIELHQRYLQETHRRCLLQESTSGVHQAILKVLDIGLHLTTLHASFTRDSPASPDLSRMSTSPRTRYRSRKQRRLRKNVISFSHVMGSEDSSSDSDDVNESVDLSQPEDISESDPNAIAPEAVAIRMDQMSNELDGLVKFVRRGVEKLSGRSGDAFGVLAFALEDWDL